MSKKLNYQYYPDWGIAYWQNENGENFEEFEIEFKRELSPFEKMAVMNHFIAGITMHAPEAHAVVFLDFMEARLLKLVIQNIKIDRTRALLMLTVKLRKMLPVLRVGNNVYSEEDNARLQE